MRSWIIVLICLLTASLAVGLTFPGGTPINPVNPVTPTFSTISLSYLPDSISVDVGERIRINAEPTCNPLFGACTPTDGINYKFTYLDNVDDSSTINTGFSSETIFDHTYYYTIYLSEGTPSPVTITVDANLVYTTLPDGTKSYCASNCPTAQKAITVYVNNIENCMGYDTPHYLSDGGYCVEASQDEGNALNSYNTKEEMEALTKKCYADIGGTMTELTEAGGFAGSDAYMPVNSRGEMAVQFGSYPGLVPLTAAEYCIATDKIDTGGRSQVKAFSWSSSDYADSEIVFTLKSYDESNTLIDTETVSSKGAQPDLDKGQYIEWTARFNPSSNPHSSMLGSVWLETEPAPFGIEAVIGLRVAEKENVVWYAKDSISPGQLIESYEWDFDDGSDLSDLGIAYHAFVTDNVGLGPYNIELTVSDDTPSSDSIIIPVEVIDA